jgi:hypothetical protein
MTRSLFFISFLLACFYSPTVTAQDTLPKFSVRNAGNNRIIIGWVNQFTNISQISIQRAFDSLGNYKTILSVPDAKAIQNGFADTKAPNDHMFYRLFYAMEGGAFYFTKSKRSVADTSTAQNAFIVSDKNVTGEAPNPLLKSFTPSFYVYTEKRGYVQLNLPNADQRKYSLKFFEEDGSFLFELKAIKDRSLMLDKSNFLHAGWFTFELYDDEKIVEKHKFYIAKDF